MDESRSRAAALGISLDAPFRCVIPGHDHDSQLVWSATHWVYRCPDGAHGLADVRAAIAYGAERHISPTEANRWRDRLDYEARIIEPVRVPVALPDDIAFAGADVKVAQGVQLYLGLRARRGGMRPAEPFTFARRFCMAWCDVSNDQARDAMKRLRAWLIRPTGERVGRAILWQIRGAGGAIAQPSVETAVVEPLTPVAEDLGVDRAQNDPEPEGDVGMVAGRDHAMGGFGHESDSITDTVVEVPF